MSGSWGSSLTREDTSALAWCYTNPRSKERLLTLQYQIFNIGILDPGIQLRFCFQRVCLSNYVWLSLILNWVLYPKNIYRFWQKEGTHESQFDLTFCCRCLDNLDHTHQSFEKLDLHNNDFHLPSSSAWREPSLKDFALWHVRVCICTWKLGATFQCPHNSNNETT